MSRFTDETPDWERPLSRFNAPYWAGMNGLFGALTSAEQAILNAIFFHLPNVACGKGRIAAISGTSVSSVKRSRKRFKDVGLIDYDEDHDGGEKHDEPTLYRVADIRRTEVADAVIARLHALQVAEDAQRLAARSDGGWGHGDPRGGAMVNPPPGHGEPTRGATMDPKVLKGRAQASTQAKPVTPPATPTSDDRGASDGFKAEGGTTHCTPTAPKGSTQQRPAPRATKGPKGLTDEQKRLACSSIEMMTRYLLYGQDGLDPAVDVTTLTPARTNFYKFQRSAEDFGVDLWSIHEFAGYYWFKVCEYREKQGQPLQLPQWGRLFAHLKALLETKTRDDLLRYLRIVAEWFTVIRFMNGGAGMSMTLNEAALCHKLVDMSVGQLGLMDANGRAELWAKASNAPGNWMRENFADAA